MAKMRMVRPEMWTDEKFVALPVFARLLFVGMWNFACDNGHLDDSVLQLKMRVLPADSVDVSELLDELVTSGMVQRGDGWIKVVNLAEKQPLDMRFLVFCDHCPHDEHRHYERSDKKETRRAPTGGTKSARSAHDEPPTSARRSGDGDGDGDGDGSPHKRKKPSTTIPETWKPTAAHQKYAAEGSLDLSTEAFKFRNHAGSVDRRAVNWNLAFTNWLANAKPVSHVRAVGDRRPEGW